MACSGVALRLSGGLDESWEVAWIEAVEGLLEAVEVDGTLDTLVKLQLGLHWIRGQRCSQASTHVDTKRRLKGQRAWHAHLKVDLYPLSVPPIYGSHSERFDKIRASTPLKPFKNY